MKIICELGCDPRKSPAIGMATLRGRLGTSIAGETGQYAVCSYHYAEAREGRWRAIVLEGFEPFPEPVRTNVATETDSTQSWSQAH